MMRFVYDGELLETFPAIWGGVIIASGLENGPPPPQLTSHYQAEQQATLARLADTPVSELPSLSAWRRAFRTFGVKPTQYRSAAEALLRRLTKKGDIPSINKLVDLGNLVSIRYGLPVAIFDTRATTGSVTVRFANGDERFTNLGTDEVQHPEPGEVIFVDEDKLVSARRWCWRQSDQSAANERTGAALITIEGHHDNAQADVKAGLDDLLELLRQYGGQSVALEAALLSASNPGI